MVKRRINRALRKLALDRDMTYSHEQPKGWGFSRRTPNLNLSANEPRSFKRSSANRATLTFTMLSSQSVITWLKTNIHTSIQSSISSMSRLLSSGVAIIANTRSTLTSSGFQGSERRYSKERWLTC